MVLRGLLSYHYARDTSLTDYVLTHLSPPRPDVFLDSGAFSALTQWATISLTDYAEYIRRHRDVVTVYANLDVIGDPNGTLANQKRMEDLGLSPMPVFHAGEPWSFLEYYVDRYPYIALGGLVGGKGRKRTPLSWFVRCFRMARGRAVYHAFGIGSWPVLKTLPWYSADATTWSTGPRFGRVKVFDERAGEWYDLDLRNHRAWYSAAPLVRSYGFDPADFVDRTRYRRETVLALSALSYQKAEDWLRRHHGPVVHPTQPDQVGARIYLADTLGGRGGDLGRVYREAFRRV